MAGISSKALAFGDPVNKEETFQGQRFDEELGLNWVQFKWRNHDPQIGRFIEIDPLSEKYVYNSTYAFSENCVTSHVELEGLERAPFQYVLEKAFGKSLETMNRNTQAKADALVRKAEPYVNVAKDVVTIAAGVTLIIASGGTAAPLVVALSGSATVAGGVMKLAFHIGGNNDAANEIPTTLLGTMAYTANTASELGGGQKAFNDDITTALEFSEGILMLNVSGFAKMDNIEKADAILSSVTLTLDAGKSFDAFKNILPQKSTKQNESSLDAGPSRVYFKQMIEDRKKLEIYKQDVLKPSVILPTKVPEKPDAL